MVDDSGAGRPGGKAADRPPARSIVTDWDTTKTSGVAAWEQKRRLARAMAVLMLRPPVERFNLLELASFDDIVKTGHDYAMQKLADWPERPQHALDSVMSTGSG